MLQLQPSRKTRRFAFRLLAVRDSDACMCAVRRISRYAVATPTSDTLFIGACATAASASTYRNVASCSSASTSMCVHKPRDVTGLFSLSFAISLFHIFPFQQDTPTYTGTPADTQRHASARGRKERAVAACGCGFVSCAGISIYTSTVWSLEYLPHMSACSQKINNQWLS